MSEQVPEGWVSAKLKDVSILTKGLTYASSDYSDEQNGLPFLTLKSISKDGGYSPIGLKFYKGEFKEHHALDIGDVLFANTDLTRDGDVVGSPLFFDGFGFDGTTLYSMDLSKLKVDPQKTHSKFLYYLLMTHRVKRYMVNSSAGSTVLHLDTNRVKELDLNLPLLPEQKKIASILTSVDEVIEKTQSQIDKLQDLKKGTMNELLTKGIGHTEFKDSELGRIPKSWEVASIAEISDFVTSGSRGWSQYYSERGAIFIRIGNLTRDNINLDFEDTVRVTPPVNGEGVRTKVSLGDILISITADLGVIGVVHEGVGEAYVNQHVSLVRLKENSSVIARWAGYYLSGEVCQYQFRIKNDGGAKAGLNLPTIRSIRLAQPSIIEQERICGILDGFDTQIHRTRIKLHQTKSLKKSLMQDLLTGKVRVSVN